MGRRFANSRPTEAVRKSRKTQCWTAMAPGAETPRPNAHVFALLHPLNGSLAAPPVGPGRARSPTDRVAPQLGGAWGEVFAIQSKAENLLPIAPPS